MQHLFCPEMKGLGLTRKLGVHSSMFLREAKCGKEGLWWMGSAGGGRGRGSVEETGHIIRVSLIILPTDWSGFL